MNKKYFWFLAFACVIPAIFIYYRKNYFFIPSAKTCRAAINPDESIVDSFERGITCMLAGHKDVYYGNIAGIIYDRIPEQYAKKEIQLITLPNGNFVLYTKKGERNAHLFAKQDQSETSRKNHYLTGYLLGYSEEDIKYFYEQNNFTNYEQDKKDALLWVNQNSK